MTEDPTTMFSFAEENHLIRIHRRFELEDAGFNVEEVASELRIVLRRATDPAVPDQDDGPDGE